MSAYSQSFTTELEPLTPSVSPDTLTIGKGRTAGFSVALGQDTAAATSASIAIADDTIASVDSPLLTGNGTVTGSGLTVGTTDVAVNFNDTSTTEKTVSVTVAPTPPIWPVGSSLTASNVTTSAPSPSGGDSSSGGEDPQQLTFRVRMEHLKLSASPPAAAARLRPSVRHKAIRSQTAAP